MNPNVLLNEHTSCTIGCFSVAVINSVDQKQLGRERFIMEESQGRNWGQALNQRPWRRLPSLLSYINQEHLFRAPLPTGGWALPYQSLIEEMSGRLDKSWSDGGDSSLWVSSFQMILFVSSWQTKKHSPVSLTASWTKPDAGEGSLDALHGRWYQLLQADDMMF